MYRLTSLQLEVFKCINAGWSDFSSELPSVPLYVGGFWGNFNDGQNAAILEGDVAKCPQCHVDRECDNVMS